jgi:hypothetical protein
MAKYGKKTKQKVKEIMKEFKEGKLKSGKRRKKVKSRKQAIAIALSEARAAGAKVPPIPQRSTKKVKKVRRRKTAKKKISKKKK